MSKKWDFSCRKEGVLLWHKKMSILMSQKLNILMSHINGFYNATINEFLMFQKQAATLEFSALGTS